MIYDIKIKLVRWWWTDDEPRNILLFFLKHYHKLVRVEKFEPKNITLHGSKDECFTGWLIMEKVKVSESELVLLTGEIRITNLLILRLRNKWVHK